MNREIRQIREVTKILTEKRLRTTIDEDLGKKTTLFRMVVRGRGKDVQTAEYAELTSQVRHDSGYPVDDDRWRDVWSRNTRKGLRKAVLTTDKTGFHGWERIRFETAK